MRLKLTLSILVMLVLVTVGAPQVRAQPPSRVLPTGVRVVQATVSFPDVPGYAHRSPVGRTFTNPARVAKLVALVDALPVASRHVICPAIAILGPQLTLVFRTGRARPVLAEAQVMVTTGSKGHSGQSPCFPIRLTVRGQWQSPRISKTFVRAVGHLMGAD